MLNRPARRVDASVTKSLPKGLDKVLRHGGVWGRVYGAKRAPETALGNRPSKQNPRTNCHRPPKHPLTCGLLDCHAQLSQRERSENTL